MHIEVDPDGGNMQEEGHQLLNVSFLQGDALPDNQAYLNGCSTVTVFKMDSYLKNVKTMPHGIKINCNAGVVMTNKLGSFRRMKVWYIPNGITNIFSMHELEKLYRVTYDSWEGYYMVHTPRGDVRFYKDDQGLPYIDLEESEEEAVTMLIQLGMGQQVMLAQSAAGGTKHTMLAEMVQANYEGYTKKDVIKAKEARRARAMMGNPSEKDYKGVVSNHLISNCPVTHTNITNSHAIFGPDLPSMQGKTVRQTPVPVVTDYVEVPWLLVDLNKTVTLAADVFFVDGTAFLIMMSRRIKFMTAEHVPVRTANSLAKHIDQVINVYA